MMFMPSLKELVLPYYLKANRASRGVLEILRVCLKHFNRARGTEAAASLSYYALFSLFPLVLVMISVVGFLIRSQDAYQTVFRFIYEVIPVSQSLIERNLNIILARRATLGLIGLVGALWSASGFFTTLVRNINRAWQGIKPRDLIRTRLMALAMIGVTILLLALSLAPAAISDLVRWINEHLPVNIRLEDTAVWPLLTVLMPAGFTYLLFIALYRWIPNTNVHWKACLWGALWSSLAWELTKYGFGIYISNRMADYELVYGSLATVLGLMLYIFLCSNIILLGAHLTATIDQRLDYQEQSAH